MALYEYKCEDCGVVSEYLVFSDSEKLSCKSCGSEKLDKLISSFAVSVKSTQSGTGESSCTYGSCCSDGSCGM